ncbi:MAG: lipopolysaccharide heptosyltransferase II [Thermodesulfobacteriota bacterium]
MLPLTALKPQSVLIRATNWVGDAVMTLPAMATIRANLPDARLCLLALPWMADVFTASPDVDEIIAYRRDGEHRGLAGKLRLAAALRARRFDAAILFQNAFEAALLAWLADIPIRAGYTTDGRGLLLTHGVPLPFGIKRRHQVHYYQTLLARLGMRPQACRLELRLPAAARAWATALLQAHGPGPFVGLNPGGAYGPAKRWPTGRFAALARRLGQEAGATVLVFGTAAEAPAAAAIRAAAPAAVLDLAGRTSLAQAAALIARCQVVVSNDSGLMHVAAALAVPLVAIFGSTNPVTTGPFSDRARVLRHPLPCSPCLATVCPNGDFSCMASISVDEVFAATRARLDRAA